MADPSTAVTATEKPNLPAPLAGYRIATVEPQRLVALIEANIAGGISAFDLTRIKVPAAGGIMWMVPSLDGPAEPQRTLEGVIVAWSDQRAYWEQAFSGAGTPPDCSARDNRTGIGLLGKGSAGNPSGQCGHCPMAKFGSAPLKPGQKESRGQACKQMRLLFIVQPGDLLPIVVAAPPTSLKNLRDYFLALAREGTPYYQAITSLRLVEDKNADGTPYSMIEPKRAAVLSDEEAARIKMFSDSLQLVFNAVDLTPEDVAG